MNELFAHHAFGAIQAVRESTRGYGPPSTDPRDPLGRSVRRSRRPRRGLRGAFARMTR